MKIYLLILTILTVFIQSSSGNEKVLATKSNMEVLKKKDNNVSALRGPIAIICACDDGTYLCVGYRNCRRCCRAPISSFESGTPEIAMP
jgi:hypothetical protein